MVVVVVVVVDTFVVDLSRSLYFGEAEDELGGKVGTTTRRKGTLLGYFTSLSCSVCEERSQSGLCVACRTDRQRLAVISSVRIHRAERCHSQLAQVRRTRLR